MKAKEIDDWEGQEIVIGDPNSRYRFGRIGIVDSYGWKKAGKYDNTPVNKGSGVFVNVLITGAIATDGVRVIRFTKDNDLRRHEAVVLAHCNPISVASYVKQKKADLRAAAKAAMQQHTRHSAAQSDMQFLAQEIEKRTGQRVIVRFTPPGFFLELGPESAEALVKLLQQR